MNHACARHEVTSLHFERSRLNDFPNYHGTNKVDSVECRETGCLYIIDQDETDAWIESDVWFELGDLEPRPEVKRE